MDHVTPRPAQQHPYYPIDVQRLNRVQEPAIEPELPIVDAHHHLWHDPDRSYVAQDFARDIAAGGHNIVASIFVECKTNYLPTGDPDARALGEITFARAQSQCTHGATTAIAAGIVGYVDLSLGEKVHAVLERAVAAGQGCLKSIRNVSVWHPDPAVRASALLSPPGLLLTPAFGAGFAQLAPLGLCFDAWIVHTQLAEVVELAARFPHTQIVLNHCAGPLGMGPYRRHRRHVHAEWRAALQRLARHENVAIKIGGLGMRWSQSFDYRPDQAPTSAELCAAWHPYIDTCIQAFGPDRCMFESNFPVDKGACAYGVLWNAFKRATTHYRTEERRMLFHATAQRIYQLSDTDLPQRPPRM